MYVEIEICIEGSISCHFINNLLIQIFKVIQSTSSISKCINNLLVQIFKVIQSSSSISKCTVIHTLCPISRRHQSLATGFTILLPPQVSWSDDSIMGASCTGCGVKVYVVTCRTGYTSEKGNNALQVPF